MQFRKQKGITQEQLARLCETTQQQIAKIEKGVVDPKLSTLWKIALALDCEVSDFFYTKKEFLSEVNAVIKKHHVNLKKINLITLNSLCGVEGKIPPFHPYWEKVEIRNNRIFLKGSSNE